MPVSAQQKQWMMAGAVGLGLLVLMSNRATSSGEPEESKTVELWRTLDTLNKEAALEISRVDEQRLSETGYLDEVISSRMLDIRRKLAKLREEADQVFRDRRELLREVAEASDDYAGQASIKSILQDNDARAERFASELDQTDYDLQQITDRARNYASVVAQYQAVEISKKSEALHAEIAILKQEDHIVQNLFNQEVHVDANLDVHNHLHQHAYLSNTLNFDQRILEWHGGPTNTFLGGNGPGGRPPGGGGGGGEGRGGGGDDPDDDDMGDDNSKFRVGKDIGRPTDDMVWVGGGRGNNPLNYVAWSPADDLVLPAEVNTHPLTSDRLFSTDVQMAPRTQLALTHSRTEAASGMVGRHQVNPNNVAPMLIPEVERPAIDANLGGSLVITGPLDDDDPLQDTAPRDGFANAPAPATINTALDVANEPKAAQPSAQAAIRLQDMYDGDNEQKLAREWHERGRVHDAPDPNDTELQKFIAEVDNLVRAGKRSKTVREIKKVRDVLMNLSLDREVSGVVDQYPRWLVEQVDPYGPGTSKLPGYRVWWDGVDRLNNKMSVVSRQQLAAMSDGKVRSGKSKASSRPDLLISDRLGKTKRARTESGQIVPTGDNSYGLDKGVAEGALNFSGMNDMVVPKVMTNVAEWSDDEDLEQKFAN